MKCLVISKLQINTRGPTSRKSYLVYLAVAAPSLEKEMLLYMWRDIITDCLSFMLKYHRVTFSIYSYDVLAMDSRAETFMISAKAFRL